MTNIPQISTTTVQQINEVGMNIFNGLAPLAEKMQMPINTVWDVMLQHNNFVGWMYIISSLTMASIFYVLYRVMSSKDVEKEATGFLLLLMLCLFIGMHYTAYLGLERLIVPKYTTTIDVINVINEIKKN